MLQNKVCFEIKSHIAQVYCVGIFFLFCYCVIFTGSTNHSSFFITSFMLYYGGMGVLISFIYMILTRNYKSGLYLMLLGILVLAFTVITNLYNIMIEYNIWIERGMPDKYSYLFSLERISTMLETGVF